MAITPKNPGAVDAPNTLTPDAAGSVAVPNSLTPESAGSVAVPNNLTPESAGTVAAPNSLTAESAGTVAVPNSLTAESAGSVAVPNSLTAETAGTVAVPNSLTAETAGAVAVPNSLTAQSAVTFPRTLTPTVSMNFADGLYEQAGQSIAESDLLTYSRASNGTFIDKYVTPSGKEAFFLNTDYVGSVTNFARYSEQFSNSAWTKTNTTVQENRAIAPDGTLTADLILDNSTSGAHLVGQSVVASIGPDLTLSVYAKRENINIFTLYEDGLNIGVEFNLLTGSARATFGTPLNYSSRHVGAGWFLCTMTISSPPSGIAEMKIYMRDASSYSGTGQGVYIWGAQVTETISVRPYVKTTLTSASQTFSESLRIGYDAATGENLGVLIEGGRTNICLYSEDFTKSNWIRNGSSVTANDAIGPDFTMGADKLISGSTGSLSIAPFIRQTVSVSLGGIYTFSTFVKRSEINFAQICFLSGNVAGDPRVNFDLSNGTIGAQDSGIDAARISSVGNGWFKISATVEAASISLTPIIALIRSEDDVRVSPNSWTAGEGLYIWGAQVEQGSTASSYIRTTTGPTSRLADQLSIPVAGNMPSGDSTVFCELDAQKSDATQFFFDASTVAPGQIDGYISASNLVSVRHGVGAAINTTTELQGSVKAVSVYDNSNALLALYVDKNLITTKTDYLSGPVASGVIGIGSSTTGTSPLLGHIKHLKIYGEALTAAEVAQL
jgi:hypothetical protein